ncbi:glycosyltransferase [Vibrio fluvialis]|nr:glycosyltransferase [Vibrio fluvialis]ELI5739453.1 glycosyltransferase [Vibrio fluvialis]HDM8040773.1 glycosyltransferase [Vibrio fluvialis]
MSNILINATNIKVGGGLQVACATIVEFLNMENEDDFIFAISTPIFKQIGDHLKDKNANYEIIDFKIKGLVSIFLCRKKLNDLIDNFNVSKVFSIFGPSFWNPKHGVSHLVGFANAWLVTPYDDKVYRHYKLSDRIRMTIKHIMLSKLLFHKDNVYVTETEVVNRKFREKFKHDEIYTVCNTLNPVYDFNDNNPPIDDLLKINKIKLITIAQNYPHKNLNVISSVGDILKKKGYSVVFIVTMEEKEYEAQTKEFKEFTLNVGVLDLKDCPRYYASCDALFLPTLIECFTASYLEAMSLKLPIITSDLDFARFICQDSAYYFDPYSPTSIADAIVRFINDDSSYLIEKYDVILSRFGNNKQRAQHYYKILEKI